MSDSNGKGGSSAKELLYDLLPDEGRAQLVRRAMFQLEQQIFECDINVTMFGPTKLLDENVPNSQTVQERKDELQGNLQKLKDEYSSLLELNPA